MKYAEVNTQIYMSMHFLLLELCVDSLEKTTLNQPQIMEEKKECQWWDLNPVPSAS